MLNEKKKKKTVVPKLRQEVKVKLDIVTSDDIKIYYTGKFQGFTARYILKLINKLKNVILPMNVNHFLQNRGLMSKPAHPAQPDMK